MQPVASDAGGVQLPAVGGGGLSGRQPLRAGGAPCPPAQLRSELELRRCCASPKRPITPRKKAIVAPRFRYQVVTSTQRVSWLWEFCDHVPSMKKSVLNRVRFLRCLRPLGSGVGENFFCESGPTELEAVVRDSLAPRVPGKKRDTPRRLDPPAAHESGFAQWLGFPSTPALIAAWAPETNSWWCDLVRAAKERAPMYAVAHARVAPRRQLGAQPCELLLAEAAIVPG